ncbi:unnamed protein product [Linum trigynum]|uniref:Uncharacterized protein n=1 Tax=Linum trigynum TaxID=586398 RepID=A0AAV2FTU8_9ROSI
MRGALTSLLNLCAWLGRCLWAAMLAFLAASLSADGGVKALHRSCHSVIQEPSAVRPHHTKGQFEIHQRILSSPGKDKKNKRRFTALSDEVELSGTAQKRGSEGMALLASPCVGDGCDVPSF